MKKKILYIVNVDKFFFSHRIEIANKAKEFFNIHIATKFKLNKNYFQKKGFFTHELFLKRGSIGFLSNILTILNIFFIIKKLKPDLIHFISIKPVLLGGIVSRLFPSIPKIFSVTGLGFVFIKKDFFSIIRRWFFKFLYKLALNQKYFKIIFQNLDDYKLIKKNTNIKKKNYELISGSGVSLKEYRPKILNFQNPIVMFPSRMLSHKGLHEFVEAAKILKKENIKAKFVLVGDIDKENPACVQIETINRWVKEKTVEYWGHKKHMNTAINLATIIVLPSYREGFPKVLIEAAACGRPSITTNVPGCRDAIINNSTGILIPPRNSIKLAQVIKNLLKNKKKIKKMGSKARKHAVKNFDINHVVNIHIKIYKNILKL